MKIEELKDLARQIRIRLIEMSHDSNAPHLGSSLSCVDILVALYWQILKINTQNTQDPLRDRCILSKGHAAAALFATLAFRGFFPKERLHSYLKNGECLAEHPSPSCIQGVELATGSLGHGLSVGLGMGLAGRIQHQLYRVFVVMSDGECNEGSVWEAALLAAANKVDNLVGIIDYNKWQATGRSNEVMALKPFKQKWDAFGWSCIEIDGHCINELTAALHTIPAVVDKPTIIIAHTIKGKGVSFMEDNNNWHYRIPTDEDVRKAKEELGA